MFISTSRTWLDHVLPQMSLVVKSRASKSTTVHRFELSHLLLLFKLTVKKTVFFPGYYSKSALMRKEQSRIWGEVYISSRYALWFWYSVSDLTVLPIHDYTD